MTDEVDEMSAASRGSHASAANGDCPGDGWRFLGLGETILTGDEWSACGSPWKPCNILIGKPLMFFHARYRRRVTQESFDHDAEASRKLKEITPSNSELIEMAKRSNPPAWLGESD